MNTRVTARNLLLIVFTFMIVSQVLYTWQNIKMFRGSYTSLTNEQVQELGEVIRNEISHAIQYGLPIERIGRVDLFLQDIVDANPNLAFIDITKEGEPLYSASRTRESLRAVSVPIPAADGGTAATIHLGINKAIERHTRRILFDLCTIVAAALIIIYELLIFLSSRLINIPGEEAVALANCQISNLKSIRYRTSAYELIPFLAQIEETVESIQHKLRSLNAEIENLSARIREGGHLEKERILSLIERQRAAIAHLMEKKKGFAPIINPSHVRPIVFAFVVAANLHSSFLPFFAKELLDQPTFLSSIFSEKVLMGLPITVYMLTVTVAMILLGTRFFQEIRPFRTLTASLFCTAVGLVLCGLSRNMLHLIFARILCAAGLALIVIQCRQFIVDHTTSQNRAYHLAGYTTAFAGGLFCSIVLGGILADYFSYRIVYFIAAAVLVFVFIFTYIVFAEEAPATVQKDAPQGDVPTFLRHFIKDPSLMAVTLHGIITRIMLVGFLYYCLPIFLREKFTYSDIGRVMMTYGLTSILLATSLNRYVKGVEQSRSAVFITNMILGAALLLFYFLEFQDAFHYALAGVVTLVVMGISNSITFPSQINLLLSTDTVAKIGSRTPMALYQSFEKIGSALGPLIFGYLAAETGIRRAIGIGGMICIGGNLLFILLYRPTEIEAARERIE